MTDTPLRLFRDRTRRWADAPALRRKRFGIWETTTWAQYGDVVRRVAKALHAIGAPRGAVSAVLSQNRPEWLFADLGAQALGLIGAGIYPTASPEQVAEVLTDSGAIAVFVEDAEQLDKVMRVRAECPNLRAVAVFDMKGLREFRDPMVRSFEDFLALGDGVHDRIVDAAIDAGAPGDIAMLIYTSGTSGPPKGAMIAGANIMFQIETAAAQTPLRHGDHTVSFLPLCHVAERMGSVFNPLGPGPVIHFPESAGTLANDLPEIAPHLIFAPPRFWEKMHARITLAMPDAIAPARWAYQAALRGREGWLGGLLDRIGLAHVREALGLGRIRHALTGAAPVSPDLLAWFNAIGVPLREAYGLTETVGFCTATPPEQRRPGTAGVPVARTEVRLGAEDEILVRGPGVFAGYWGKQSATAAAIDAEGWLHTGDCGSFDEAGHLSIRDRIKDILITSGGKNIAPSTIENQLKFSPYISDAVVIGEARQFLTALVLADPETTAQFAQDRQLTYTDNGSLMRHPEIVALIGAEIERVNITLARVETIKAFRLIEEQLVPEDEEVTPTMKLKRRMIARRYAALIDDMYGGDNRPATQGGSP